VTFFLRLITSASKSSKEKEGKKIENAVMPIAWDSCKRRGNYVRGELEPWKKVLVRRNQVSRGPWILKRQRNKLCLAPFNPVRALNTSSNQTRFNSTRTYCASGTQKIPMFVNSGFSTKNILNLFRPTCHAQSQFWHVPNRLCRSSWEVKQF
jgi:hypothetical protein